MAEGSMNEDVLRTAQSWHDAGQRVALATVTATWGSSPRPVGSLLAVREDGTFEGSVSGGCIEGAVIGEAQGAMSDGKVRNLEFSVSNETAWEVGLTCGGTVRVFVEPLS
jgi:xanthine/CO dehydrogenase XdhC/CoxF family maturation factor